MSQTFNKHRGYAAQVLAILAARPDERFTTPAICQLLGVPRNRRDRRPWYDTMKYLARAGKATVHGSGHGTGYQHRERPPAPPRVSTVDPEARRLRRNERARERYARRPPSDRSQAAARPLAKYGARAAALREFWNRDPQVAKTMRDFLAAAQVPRGRAARCPWYDAMGELVGTGEFIRLAPVNGLTPLLKNPEFKARSVLRAEQAELRRAAPPPRRRRQSRSEKTPLERTATRIQKLAARAEARAAAAPKPAPAPRMETIEEYLARGGRVERLPTFGGAACRA